MSDFNQKQSFQLEKSVIRLIIYFLTLIAILILAYSFLPIINYLMRVVIPVVDLPLGILFITCISSMFCFAVIRFLGNILDLIGLEKRTLARFLTHMALERMGILRKTLFNFSFIVFLVVVFFALLPFISLIPEVGKMLTTSIQLVITAIVVLFFWDVGRILQYEIERSEKRIFSKYIEIKLNPTQSILKTFVSLLTFASIMIVTYSIAPLTRFSFNLVIPFLEISIGLLTYIILLGLLVFAAIRFIKEAFSTLRFTGRGFSERIHESKLSHFKYLRRIHISFVMLSLFFVIYWIISPMVIWIPSIGSYFVIVSQVILTSIIVLVSWDIGRIAYRQLETKTNRVILFNSK